MLHAFAVDESDIFRVGSFSNLVLDVSSVRARGNIASPGFAMALSISHINILIFFQLKSLCVEMGIRAGS